MTNVEPIQESIQTPDQPSIKLQQIRKNIQVETPIETPIEQQIETLVQTQIEPQTQTLLKIKRGIKLHQR